MRRAFTLAFRNLFRSPKRSLSLLALMCAAFLALTLIKAGYADMFANIKESNVRNQGDLCFNAKNAQGMGMAAYRDLRAKALADGRFRDLKAAVSIQGLAGTETRSAPLSGISIDGSFGQWRTEDGSAKAEMGESLARSLDLKEGDRFSALVNGSGFSLALDKIVKTEATARDRFYLRMPLEALEEAGAEARVDQVQLWLAPARGGREALIGEVRAWPEFSGYDCAAYELGNTVVNSIVKVYEDNFRVVLAVVAATMLLALMNVMLLSSWERGQEWGTMLALGDSYASVGAVILAEALLMALAASAAGGILTLAISAAVNALGGITLPAPPTATQPIHVGMLPELSAFALALGVTALCGVAASIAAAASVGRNTVIELLFERN